MTESVTLPDELNAIRLLNRYGVAVDSKRWDFFDAIFAPDVIADYGGPVVFDGLPAFRQGAADAWGPFDASQHSMSNIVWDRDGDVARSLTYGDWFIIRHGTPGGDIWKGKGWYHDEWAKLECGWRIRRRCCRTMWADGNPLVPNANFDPDGFDGTDFKFYSIADAVAEGLFSFFDSPRAD